MLPIEAREPGHPWPESLVSLFERRLGTPVRCAFLKSSGPREAVIEAGGPDLVGFWPTHSLEIVRAARHDRRHWQALVACSNCADETEAVVEDLDDLERQVCPCGYSYVVLSIATFEPVYSECAELIKLPAPRKLPLTA